MKDEEWDDIQATNLKSVFVLSRAVLRGMMKARAGRIVQQRDLGGRLHRQRRPDQLRRRQGGIDGLSSRSPARSAAANITVNCVVWGSSRPT
jgi:3-oxoacyl-[acyl-carrier protein] reductase